MPYRIKEVHLTLTQEATGRYGVGQPLFFLEVEMTNLEWIKGLPIEEMAEFLAHYDWTCIDCPEEPGEHGENCSWGCEEHCQEWLAKEHEMRISSEFEKEWL